MEAPKKKSKSTKSSDKSKPQPSKPSSSSSAGAKSLGRGLREHVDTPTNDKQKINAKELNQAKSSIPHNYTTTHCRVDNLLTLIKQTTKKNEKVTLNDWSIRAAGLSLKHNPQVNRIWDPTQDEPKQLSNIDISVVVNDNLDGNVVPLQQVDRKGPLAISKYLAEQNERLKSNEPTKQASGALTISNLGLQGVSHFSSIVNFNQTCFLAIGAPTNQFILSEFNEDESRDSTTIDLTSISKGTFLNATLSCDERVVDSALAAQWLGTFKEYLEQPEKML